jgi:hypothetical protein
MNLQAAIRDPQWKEPRGVASPTKANARFAIATRWARGRDGGGIGG